MLKGRAEHICATVSTWAHDGNLGSSRQPYHPNTWLGTVHGIVPLSKPSSGCSALSATIRRFSSLRRWFPPNTNVCLQVLLPEIHEYPKTPPHPQTLVSSINQSGPALGCPGKPAQCNAGCLRATFCRRRHQPRRPPLAKIRIGQSLTLA